MNVLINFKYEWFCRSAQLQLEETEIGGVRAKCIPRKQKALPSKKESNYITSSNSVSSNGQGAGSKRHE